MKIWITIKTETIQKQQSIIIKQSPFNRATTWLLAKLTVKGKTILLFSTRYTYD